MTARSEPVIIVGAGIVGLATALALSWSPERPPVTIVEKELAVAQHQSGHNSGVIHSGPYYRPGSLKARLCTEGRARLLRYLDEHRIRYELCGKVIVAATPQEVPALEEIHRRGLANGIEGMRLLDPEQLGLLEPHVVGARALHVPTTGIVDYQVVSRAMSEELHSLGAEILLGTKVRSAPASDGGVRVVTNSGTISGRYLVNCAGLYSDRVASSSGATPPVRIVPFRGEYYRVRSQLRSLVRGLVYPVPDPEQPFLGVHLTPTIHGELEAGPNAVLAFSREGYSKRSIVPSDLAETLRTPGFARMARRWWRSGLFELVRSMSKTIFARSLQRLVPEIEAGDLIPGGAGVRAQALAPDGMLLDDFVFCESRRALHVLNAPSPAATASLAIGQHIAARALAAIEIG